MTPPGACDDLMREALELAARGRRRVEPNPPVGAIVLGPGGDVVGRGYHAVYGGPHAEAAALADAGDAARGGTLIVTLEPCAHTEKKTPPCVPAVIAAGITRVVVGASDPNPATRGRAATQLADAGVAYEEGVLRDECDAALARYASHLAQDDLPWTIAKWAMSADGRTADHRRAARWITGEAARTLVHELRASVEAVVVGRGTVAADDPALTCRIEGRPSPLRVVLDSGLGSPLTARVVADARTTPTLFFCAAASGSGGGRVRRRDALRNLGVEVEEMPADAVGRVDVAAAFAALRARGVRRVLLEGGGRVTGACLRAGVVHQVLAFTAPVVLGGDGAPQPFLGAGWDIARAPRLEDPRVTQLGDDALLEAYWPA